MNFQKFLLNLVVLLLVVFATSSTSSINCAYHSNGLFSTDEISYMTTLYCDLPNYADTKISAKLVFSEDIPYHATYYLKEADGTFTEILPETEIQLKYALTGNQPVAEVEIYAQTSTNSTDIVVDKLDFTFTSDATVDFSLTAQPLNYMATTTDALTLFKLNSQLHPAITETTSDDDLKKITILFNASVDSLGFSVPLMCQQSTAERVKALNIANLGDKCFNSATETKNKQVISKFLDIYMDSVDSAGDFNFPLTHDNVESTIIHYQCFDLLSKISWPSDTEGGEHELSDKIDVLIAGAPLEHIPVIIYTIINALKPENKYFGETSGELASKLDVVTLVGFMLSDLLGMITRDPIACHRYEATFNFENTFKNAYGVENRLSSVAPTENVLQQILMLETMESSIAAQCGQPGTFGNSLKIFLDSMTPDEYPADLKTTANATPVSATNVRILHAAGLYDLTSDAFKALPAKYFDQGSNEEPAAGLAAAEPEAEFMLTYIFDAFTALAEVVGPSQKAISAYFTSPVLAGTTTHIIEALVDKEGETVQLEFAVKLMKDLYVDPCSYENPTYASAAVESVVTDVCNCQQVVKFTETAATCEAAGLSVGAIAGIAVGAAVVVAVIAGGAFFIIKKKSANNSNDAATQL